MKYNSWGTVFDTASKKITHNFEFGRITVVSDQEDQKIEVFKDGIVIEQYHSDIMTVDQYHAMLVHLAAYDYGLGKKSAENSNLKSA